MNPTWSRPDLQLVPGEAQHVPISRAFTELILCRQCGSTAGVAVTLLLFQVGNRAASLCAHTDIT